MDIVVIRDHNRKIFFKLRDRYILIKQFSLVLHSLNSFPKNLKIFFLQNAHSLDARFFIFSRIARLPAWHGEREPFHRIIYEPCVTWLQVTCDCHNVFSSTCKPDWKCWQPCVSPAETHGYKRFIHGSAAKREIVDTGPDLRAPSAKNGRKKTGSETLVI